MIGVIGMKKWKKFPVWAKILSVTAFILVTVGICVGCYANYLYGKMKVENKEDVKLKEEKFDKDKDSKKLEETDPNEIKWNKTGEIKSDKEVVNILIAGEEAVHDDRGRTDAILIATMNLKQNSLKLTSILRDTYVQIPGYSDNKINAAYHNGGMPLLEETIEENFDIEIDGYILVDFDGFESIIDKLGGVSITVSADEASYLNRKNYITDYRNRNLYAGTINMNGDQALGYARVRYVANGNQAGDFGRTQRHRILLSAIFDRVKDKSATELLEILPDMLSLVTTNISRTQCVEYITLITGMNVQEIETFRLPIEDSYRLTRIRTMSVVLPENMQANIDALHDFVFGVQDIVTPESDADSQKEVGKEGSHGEF